MVQELPAEQRQQRFPLRPALLPAARMLAWSTKTGVGAWQWILTVVMWAVLGFRRFFHLDDLRHQADLGLALFTGRLRLLADSTVWRLIHTVRPESVDRDEDDGRHGASCPLGIFIARARGRDRQESEGLDGQPSTR